MMHSTHFIYSHIVKNNLMRERERGNLMAQLHVLLFSISSNCSFYMYHPSDRTVHTMAFITPVMEHWLEQEIIQWVHHEGSIR